jgi:hypothetical protein
VQVSEEQLAKQNTDEEGVFISKDALEQAGQEIEQATDSAANLRRALSSTAAETPTTSDEVEDITQFVTLHPTEIRTFVVLLVPRHTQLQATNVVRGKDKSNSREFLLLYLVMIVLTINFIILTTSFFLDQTFLKRMIPKFRSISLTFAISSDYALS